jgi:hypothetical protein
MRKILESVWWQVYVWWWAILSYSHFDKNSGNLEFLVLPAFFFNLQFFLCVFLFYVNSLFLFLWFLSPCVFSDLRAWGKVFLISILWYQKFDSAKLETSKNHSNTYIRKTHFPKILQIFSKKQKKLWDVHFSCDKGRKQKKVVEKNHFLGVGIRVCFFQFSVVASMGHH